MYKACILDIDGTLLDSVESIAHVGNRVLSEYGLQARPIEEYRYFAGDGADETVRRALLAAGDNQLIHLKEGCILYRTLFAQDPLYKVRAFDTMKETLDELKKRDVHLAVFSNKPHGAAVRAIETIYGQGCFDTILGQQEGIPRKPSPDGAWQIADFLGVKPEECIYVGDTDTDMQTGKAAGMLTVGVTWGFRDRRELEENHADVIIARPLELISVWERS